MSAAEVAKAVEARDCACGCGEQVGKKSTFRPGHDARLVSGLVSEIVAGGAKLTEAVNEVRKTYGEALAGKLEKAAGTAVEKAEAKAEREAIRAAGTVAGVVTVRGKDREANRNSRGVITYVDAKGEKVKAEGKVAESFVPND